MLWESASVTDKQIAFPYQSWCFLEFSYFDCAAESAFVYLQSSLTHLPVCREDEAKILSAADVGDLLVFASCTRQPLRNTVMVLLSAKAGLRAGEIANLTWDMVVDANGQISGLIELADGAAKKCSGRSIPIHPDLAAALAAWRQVSAVIRLCDRV